MLLIPGFDIDSPFVIRSFAEDIYLKLGSLFKMESEGEFRFAT